MDFIEQWLRLSPDGGTGALETFYAAAAAAGLILLLHRAVAALIKRLPNLMLRRR
ncbi:MAG: hypothetical protein WB810_06850 [Candidatus Cybelea sp.]